MNLQERWDLTIHHGTDRDEADDQTSDEVMNRGGNNKCVEGCRVGGIEVLSLIEQSVIGPAWWLG